MSSTIPCTLPHPLIYHMIEDYKANAAPPDFEWWYVEGLGIVVECESDEVEEWIRAEAERVEKNLEVNYYED